MPAPLTRERACLDAYLPGLRAGLEAMPLAEREQRRGPGLRLFREAGGAALLVPERYRGRGATALEAVRVQRAVGALSPSLAVGTTMHHFSTVALAELALEGTGVEWVLLQAVAQNGLLLASGFAEGNPGQHVLRPTMTARRVPGGLLVSGSKRPCSLTWSMDLLTASVLVPEEGGGPGRIAVAVVPARSEGIERREFWTNTVLAGAESDEVKLCDVFVPERLLLYPDDPDLTRDRTHARGFAWFVMLIAASYLGMASALAERVHVAGRASAGERAWLAAELEGAMHALERLALTFDRAGPDEVDLGEWLLVRFSVEEAIVRASMRAAALLGGMAFIGSTDVSYLLAASRALAYHPPAFATAAEPLARYLAGEPFALGVA